MRIGLHKNWTRHSLILLGAGAIYIGIGIGFLNAPPIVAKDPSLKVALQWLTVTQWGWVYIGAGIAAMISSLWPMGKKVWGYMMLTALSIAWGLFYAIAILFYGAPALSWISALIWGLLAFIWWAVSGLISPQHVRVMNDGPD